MCRGYVSKSSLKTLHLLGEELKLKQDDSIKTLLTETSSVSSFAEEEPQGRVASRSRPNKSLLRRALQLRPMARQSTFPHWRFTLTRSVSEILRAPARPWLSPGMPSLPPLTWWMTMKKLIRIVAPVKNSRCQNWFAPSGCEMKVMLVLNYKRHKPRRCVSNVRVWHPRRIPLESKKPRTALSASSKSGFSTSMKSQLNGMLLPPRTHSFAALPKRALYKSRWFTKLVHFCILHISVHSMNGIQGIDPRLTQQTKKSRD